MWKRGLALESGLARLSISLHRTPKSRHPVNYGDVHEAMNFFLVGVSHKNVESLPLAINHEVFWYAIY